MKVGDLVGYIDEDGQIDAKGIIVRGPWDTFKGNREVRQYQIVWYTCDSKGWWEEENLEILSESR